MFKTEQEKVLDKLKQYEDLSEVTFDQFKKDVLSAYELEGNKKAEKLFLLAWRNVSGLRKVLGEFDYYVVIVRMEDEK